MLDVLFKDATLWRWRFFHRLDGLESSGVAEENGRQFEKALEQATRWAGLEPAKPDWSALPAGRQNNARLYGSGWHKSGGVERSVEARAMLDAYYIQSGCAEQSNRGAAVVLRLREAEQPWAEAAGSLGDGRANIFGDAICITAEVSRRTGEREVKALAAESLGRWPAQAEQEIATVRLDCGFLSTVLDAETESWLLFVWDNDEARQQAASLIHRFMPAFLLARVKWRFIVKEFEQKLLPRMRTLETQLSSELAIIATQSRSLRLLEHGCEAISRIQVPFAQELNLCAEWVETLRVNTDNLARLLANPIFGRERAQLEEWAVAPLRLSREQLATDLRYLALTQSQADRMLRGIRTMSQLRSGRLETGLSILLELFVVLELFRAFPELHESLKWYWRIPIILGSMALLYVIIRIYIWWNSRSS